MLRVIIILCGIALVGCSACQRKNQDRTLSQEEIDARLMEINRDMVGDEAKQIKKYIKQSKLDFEDTGTGLRLHLIDGGGLGLNAVNGQIALVHYTMGLLDGTTISTSREGKPQTFKIAGSEVESGLHEGITYMKVGDKATMILPSHLAHGLAGDLDRVPPRSPIVYQVELIALK